MQSILFRTLIAALLLVLSTLELPEALAQAAKSTVPEPGAYANGGIGEESLGEMLVIRNLYNLRLTFAEKGSGAYVTGVRVTVQGGGGGAATQIYEDCGPLLYLALNSGTYHISATYAGVTQKQTVFLRRRALDRVLYWKAD